MQPRRCAIAGYGCVSAMTGIKDFEDQTVFIRIRPCTADGCPWAGAPFAGSRMGSTAQIQTEHLIWDRREEPKQWGPGCVVAAISLYGEPGV